MSGGRRLMCEVRAPGARMSARVAPVPNNQYDLLSPRPAPSSLRCPQHQGDCGRWPVNGAYEHTYLLLA